MKFMGKIISEELEGHIYISYWNKNNDFIFGENIGGCGKGMTWKKTYGIASWMLMSDKELKERKEQFFRGEHTEPEF